MHYTERDIMELDRIGGYYSRHVNAMTAEKLHSKTDIAAELAYRDMIIEKKLQSILELSEALESVLAEAIDEYYQEHDESGVLAKAQATIKKARTG